MKAVTTWAQVADAAEGRPAVLLVSAPWCGACVPVKKALSTSEFFAENRSVLLEVDADEESELGEDLRVSALPTIFFVRPPYRTPPAGAISGSQVEAILGALRSFLESEGAEIGVKRPREEGVEGEGEGRGKAARAEASTPPSAAATAEAAGRVSALSAAEVVAHRPPAMVLDRGAAAALATSALFPTLTWDGRRLQAWHLRLVPWVWEQRVPEMSRAELAELLSFRVPVLTEDGTCGVGLEERPHEVLPGFGARSTVELNADREVHRVWRLREVVRHLGRELGVEWAGLYRVSTDPSTGAPALVKEAYVGAHSRAYFPLTPDFAAKSNNSTVAMTGRAVVYEDLAQGLSPDAPYYVCDTRVLFEACIPIAGAPDDASPGTALATRPGAAPGVCALLDVEAWRPRHLTREGVALLLHICKHLAEVHWP